MKATLQATSNETQPCVVWAVRLDAHDDALQAARQSSFHSSATEDSQWIKRRGVS